MCITLILGQMGIGVIARVVIQTVEIITPDSLWIMGHAVANIHIDIIGFVVAAVLIEVFIAGAFTGVVPATVSRLVACVIALGLRARVPSQ